MLGVYLAQGVFTAIHGVIMIRIGQYFVADIRSALFRHFQALSMDYHDRHRTGDLMSRISNDSETINQILSNGLIQFTTNILSLGGIMVAMLLLNLPLAIGTLIILPIMLWITRQITERTRKSPSAACRSNLGCDERGHGGEYHRHPRRAGLRPGETRLSSNSSKPAQAYRKVGNPRRSSSRRRWAPCSPP